MGKVFKKAIKGIGKVAGGALKVAAPLAGLIPGVGIPLGAALGAGGNLLGRALSGDETFGDMGQTALSAGGGAAASGLLGGAGFKGLGGVDDKLVNLGFGNAQGKLDIGKLAGIGMAGANLVGAGQQRKQNQRSSDAQNQMRNDLMTRILQQPQHDFNLPQ